MSWDRNKVTIYQDELIGEYVFYIGKLHRVVDADDFFFTLRECDVTDFDEIVEFDDGHHDRYVNAEEMEHILSRIDVVIHKIKMWTKQEELKMEHEVFMDLLKGETSDGEMPRAKLAIEMTPEEHVLIECKSNYTPMIFTALEDLIRSLRWKFKQQDKSDLFDVMMEQLLENLMDETMKDEDIFDGANKI